MKHAGQNRQRRSKCLALGGMLAALALVFMLLGGIFPFATFLVPILAGVCLMPIAIEVGTKFGLLAYLAVGLLSLLIVPDKELCLLFLSIFGYYPLLQPRIAQIRYLLLRWGTRFLLFNGAVALTYFILLVLMASPALAAEFSNASPWFLACFIGLANFTFVVYDIMVRQLRIAYICKIRGRIFKQ